MLGRLLVKLELFGAQVPERTPKQRCSNLKPLEPDIHGTGKWNFRGHNLKPEEVEMLTRNGVDWRLDVMPDGRLKLPKFRRSTIRKRKKVRQRLRASIKQEQRDLKSEYEQLPDPKPGFFEWAFKQDESDFYNTLAMIAKNPHSGGQEKIRAIATLAEWSKRKPKTELEIGETAPDFEQMDVHQLLRTLLETAGINWDRFQEWCNSEDFQISIH